MNLELVEQAPLAIQIHLATVIPAFFIGSWLILASTKGSRVHRSLGFVYLPLMVITALSTLFIHAINPGGFSLIHLFVPLTLFGVVRALVSIRRGNINGHKRAMVGLYVGALVIAGGLTFLPGRLMYRIFFG